MRINRTFVWRDGRPDDEDEIRSEVIDRLVSHGGARFVLRSWDLRFPPGEPRVTEAVYDEIHSAATVDRAQPGSASRPNADDDPLALTVTVTCEAAANCTSVPET